LFGLKQQVDRHKASDKNGHGNRKGHQDDLARAKVNLETKKNKKEGPQDKGDVA